MPVCYLGVGCGCDDFGADNGTTAEACAFVGAGDELCERSGGCSEGFIYGNGVRGACALGGGR
jgi:hypothetical protein